MMGRCRTRGCWATGLTICSTRATWRLPRSRFAPHESGWIYWARDGGVFTVDRFVWHTTGRRRLELRIHRSLSGIWTVREGHVYHSVDEQSRCNDALSFTYTVGVGRDAIGGQVTVLELDRPVSVGVIGERFAFEHGGVRGEDDPTRRRRRV